MIRELKDSGIDWLGEIPVFWEIKKIGSVYRSRNEKVSDKDYMPLSVTKNGIVPQLDSAAKTNAGDNRKLVCIGDFVINSRSDRRGSCGISSYNGSVSLISTVLEPSDEIYNPYYAYVFKTESFSDEFYKWGTGIVDDLWSTNWARMKNIYIPFPQYQYQKLIADYLDKKCSEINDIIEKTKASIQEYKIYKQSIITEAVSQGINPKAQMKSSGFKWLGEIPVHWEVSTLLKCIAFEGGSQPPSIYFQDTCKEGYIRLIQNRDYKTDDYATYIPINMARKFCTAQDVMVGRYGPPIFVLHRGLEGAYNVALMKAVPLKMDTEYMFYYLQQKTLINYVESFSLRAAGQSGVNPEILRKYPTPLPPLKEQKEIADYLNTKCTEIDKIISQKQQLISELYTYKNSLIYECVTGKKEA